MPYLCIGSSFTEARYKVRHRVPHKFLFTCHDRDGFDGKAIDEISTRCRDNLVDRTAEYSPITIKEHVKDQDSIVAEEGDLQAVSHTLFLQRTSAPELIGAERMCQAGGRKVLISLVRGHYGQSVVRRSRRRRSHQLDTRPMRISSHRVVLPGGPPHPARSPSEEVTRSGRYCSSFEHHSGISRSG